MGRKMGKQILKREKQRRKEERRKEEEMLESTKLSNQLWNDIWKGLRGARHEFEEDNPHGLSKCFKCELVVNQIIEKSADVGHLLTCCPRCVGRGTIKIERYPMTCTLCGSDKIVDKKDICSVCKGKGWGKDWTCTECNATGRVGGMKK